MAAPSDERSPSSELVLDVVALLRRTGTQRDVLVDVSLDDVTTSFSDAVSLDGVLVVESMADSLTLSGELSLAWSGACRRCIEPAKGVVQLELREVFERHPVEGETYQLGAESIDLRPMLEEAVLLALPMAPLCGDECEGPAPQTYPAEVAANASDHAAPDPRWAALDQLVFDDDPADGS